MPVPAQIVDKSGLAGALGWSRTRLDRCINRDAAFPVIRRGGRAGGWEFDVDQVRRHVGAPKPQASAGPPVATRKIVDKSELCAILGWSRTRLDRRLKEDPLFPVVRVGDQSGGWEFDPVEVQAYLAGKSGNRTASPAPALDPAQLRDTIAPSLPAAAAPPRGRHSAQHAGEATARQRKDAAQASLLELKLGIERGKLLLAEDARRVWSDIFAHIVTHLDRLPEALVKQFDLPQTGVEYIRRFIDDVRIGMARDLEKLCTDPKSNPAPEGGNNAATA